MISQALKYSMQLMEDQAGVDRIPSGVRLTNSLDGPSQPPIASDRPFGMELYVPSAEATEQRDIFQSV
jgi:hypothetical protein